MPASNLGFCYGVATISRLLKIISLFCKRALKKRLYSANATWYIASWVGRQEECMSRMNTTFDECHSLTQHLMYDTHEHNIQRMSLINTIFDV